MVEKRFETSLDATVIEQIQCHSTEEGKISIQYGIFLLNNLLSVSMMDRTQLGMNCSKRFVHDFKKASLMVGLVKHWHRSPGETRNSWSRRALRVGLANVSQE